MGIMGRGKDGLGGREVVSIFSKVERISRELPDCLYTSLCAACRTPVFNCVDRSEDPPPRSLQAWLQHIKHSMHMAVISVFFANDFCSVCR